MKKNSIGVSKPFFTMFLYCLIIKIQYEKLIFLLLHIVVTYFVRCQEYQRTVL